MEDADEESHGGSATSHEDGVDDPVSSNQGEGRGSGDASEEAGEGGEEPLEEGMLECDECGAPVHVDDDRCEECGSVQMISTSNILKYGVLGVLGLGLTYVFGVALVNAFPPTDALSLLLFLAMLAIALIGPLLLVASALGYRKRKEVLD